MKQRWVNRYTMNWERIMEWHKHSFKKDWMKPVWLVLMVMAGVLGVVSMIQYAPGLGITYIFLFSYSLYQGFFHKKHLLRRNYEVSCQKQGGKEWVRTITIEETIQVEDGNTNLTYGLDQVKTVQENEDYFYIAFKKGMGVRLLKQGFVEGEGDMLVKWLTENQTHNQL